MAASSVFQRSSWKVFQEAAIFLPAASAGAALRSSAADKADSAAPKASVLTFFIWFLPGESGEIGALTVSMSVRCGRRLQPIDPIARGQCSADQAKSMR